MTIENSMIHNNTAENGGGIRNSGDMTINNSYIYNNGAVFGGGIYNGADFWGDATMALRDSIVCYNTASKDGGGIYNTGSLSITGDTSLLFFIPISQIYRNIASEDGGGIWNNGIITMNNSIIHQNTAMRGGGIFNGVSNNGTAALEDIMIHHNSADSDSGGIFNAGSLSITGGSLILCNKADADKTIEYDGHGGGIFYTEGNEPLLLGVNHIRGNTPDNIYPPMT